MAQALTIFTKLNDWENIAEANRIMGLIYRDKKEYSKASIYFNKAEELIHQENFQSQVPRSIILSTIYLNQAQNNAYRNLYESAIDFAQKSLGIALPNKYIKTMSEDYLILNRVYERKLQIDSAYKYLKLK